MNKILLAIIIFIFVLLSSVYDTYFKMEFFTNNNNNNKNKNNLLNNTNLFDSFYCKIYDYK